MENFRFLAAIILFLTIAVASDATSRLLQDTDTVTDPSPPPKSEISKESDAKSEPESSTPAISAPPSEPVKKEESKDDSPPNSVPPPVGSSGDEDKENPPPPPIAKEEDSMDKVQVEGGNCDAAIEQCHDEEDALVACLWRDPDVSNGLFVLVQNKGENAITIGIKPTQNISVDVMNLDLPKHYSTRVKVVKSDSTGGEIVLSSGRGNCTIHIKPTVSDWQQTFQQFAAYATHLTPIYGVYFLVFTVAFAGIMWACCKFARGRRVDARAPYQQLEMGSKAQSSSAVPGVTSTADGWEDGWGDDDWDEEEAVVKSSDKNPSGSVSANGLSSRSHKNNDKSGWDVDWDD